MKIQVPILGYESIGSYHTLHLLREFALYVEQEGSPPTESERPITHCCANYTTVRLRPWISVI